MREVYLDNSATTKVNDQVAQIAIDAMVNAYGNPSSLHKVGLKAQLVVEKARGQIAKALSCDSSCIYFTSGGTEANNTAVFGAASAKKRQGNKIITTSFEHSSVLEAFDKLKTEGYNTVFINPDTKGAISVDNIIDAVDDTTILVSIMAINNEVGTIMPIAEIVKAVRRKNPKTIIHCDAVQAFGKISINAVKLDIDLMSISGHKIHAPKGVGALYIKKGVRINPYLFGGEQQNKLRPGTEGVPQIAAFGKAAELATENILMGEQNLKEVCRYLEERVEGIEGIYLNSPKDASPYIRNISIVGYRSEIMLHALEEYDVFVSSGSACAKGEKSHVLKAMGLDNKRLDSAIRISFNKENTKEDIDILFDAVQKSMARIIKAK